MSLPPADLRLERDGPILVAGLQGDIDMSNAREIRRHLSAQTTNDLLGLVLDLSGVEYIDSTGLHLIHHLREDLRAGGQQLVLVIPDASPVRITMRLAGLDWAAGAVSSVEQARDVLAPSGAAPISAEAERD